MTKISPTQRTLKWLRNLGYTAQVVEKFNMFAHVRIDLFGCIDVVAIKPDSSGVTGIQSTTSVHFQERIRKAISIPSLKIWLQAGNTFLVQVWRKNAKNRWVSKEKFIDLTDLK